MITTWPQSKISLSRWILLIFTLILLLAGLRSVFFQAPASMNNELNKYRSLFSEQEVKAIHQLTLKNRLGTFTFNRMPDQKNWKMSSPRSVMANSVPLNKMLKALQEVKIRSIFERDPINISNFSLENPLISIDFQSKNVPSKKLLFGLLNPIDNSTYLMFEEGDVIFHVNAIGFTLESLDLASFIDSRVFPIPPQEIKSFKIFKSGRNQLTLKQKDKRWFDGDENALRPEKVLEYLSTLGQLRSLFIIDQKGPELESALERYLERPLYTLEVLNQENQLTTYTLSPIISQLPQIKTEGRQNFIIQSSARDYPFLLNKDALKLFQQSDRSFKKLEIDEMFY